MNNIKISIVTVCYNSYNTIENTILSVINQTYNNIEYIVIDGASTDGTIDVVNKYRHAISYFVSEVDLGIYDAMNKALKLATGDFLYFIGADDVFCDDRIIENVVDKISKEDSVYYGNVRFGDTRHIHWGMFNKWKWGICNISHQAIFYPKSIYKMYMYDLKYRVYADYAYNLNLLIHKVDFRYVNIIFTRYDLGGFSSRNKDIIFEKDKFKLIVEAVGFFPACCGILYRFLLTIKQLIVR